MGSVGSVIEGRVFERIERGMTDQVISEVEAGVGIVRLNRPSAINALTTDMCRTIDQTLVDWLDDDAVTAVLLESTSVRGLCAGVDVRAIRESALAGNLAEALEFWQVEYRLDARLARYPKPITVLMDGIVMGGGVGLAAYATRRIVTERTRCAMPETAIGYFPDVAVTWLLARAPGELGTHMAMTGDTVTGADAIAVGLADTIVDSSRLPDVRAALLEGRKPHGPAVEPPPSPLVAQRDWIDQCYQGNDPCVIVNALSTHPDPDARAAASLLRRRSPLSVALALAAVRQAAELPDMEATLERDGRLNQHILERSDFVEGVRTVLVDKGTGEPPRWLYPRIEDVPAALVQRMLA